MAFRIEVAVSPSCLYGDVVEGWFIGLYTVQGEQYVASKKEGACYLQDKVKVYKHRKAAESRCHGLNDRFNGMGQYFKVVEFKEE